VSVHARHPVFTLPRKRGRAGWGSPISSSPDRADALVWAFSALLVSPMPNARFFDYYRELALFAGDAA
jgi:hypothetical protein